LSNKKTNEKTKKIMNKKMTFITLPSAAYKY